MTAEAFPLAWPAGRPRTVHYKRENAKFEVTFARARDNTVADGGRLRTEVVWLNPACSAALQRSRGGLFAEVGAA